MRQNKIVLSKLVYKIWLIIFACLTLYNILEIFGIHYAFYKDFRLWISLFSACISFISIAYITYKLRYSSRVKNELFSDTIKNFCNVTSVWGVVIIILSIVICPILKLDKTSGLNGVSQEYITNFYTAFIALCTTFVVGFQIYNSIELNKKITELNIKSDNLEKDFDERQAKLQAETYQLKAALNEKITELDRKIKEQDREIITSKYYNAYNNGNFRYSLAFINNPSNENPKHYCWHSIRALFNSVKYALYGGHDLAQTIDAADRKISKCIKILSEENTGIAKKNLIQIVNDTNDTIEEIQSYLDNDTNHSIGRLNKRRILELIASWNNLQDNELVKCQINA